MGKHKRKFSFESTNMISYVWSKRKMLFIVSLIAAVVSAIISLTITPKYRSSVILFPASSASVSKTLLSDNNFGKTDLLQFGAEEEGEQLLQVLNSAAIKEKIIEKFQLVKHYDIDTSERYWKTSLYNEFNGNIKFRRTEYMSIVIDVLDYDPDTAALIANEISFQIDTVMSHIQSDRAKKALAIVEKEYYRLLGQISQMEDSLQKIGNLGVLHLKSQSEAYTKAYADALEKGNTRGARQIEEKMKMLAKYGSISETVREIIKAESERLSALNGKYSESKVDAEQVMPYKFVVDMAYPSEKKASPKRSLIVLISTLSAFFMTLMLLIVRDSLAPKLKD